MPSPCSESYTSPEDITVSLTKDFSYTLILDILTSWSVTSVYKAGKAGDWEDIVMVNGMRSPEAATSGSGSAIYRMV